MRKSYYLGPDIRYLKTHRLDILADVLFRIVLSLGLLLSLYYTLFCYGIIASTMQDLRKYSGLGGPDSFWYYFDHQRFHAEAYPFGFVTVQLILYVVLCRRANNKKPSWISVLYFSAMAVFHIFLYLHASSLNLPSTPIRDDAKLLILRYREFARLSLIHPFLYLAVYLLNMVKYRKNYVPSQK